MTEQLKVPATYGLTVAGSVWEPRRSAIQAPELAPAGNLVFRVGRENEPNGNSWHQTEHVVLTAEEAVSFLTASVAALPNIGQARVIEGVFEVQA